MQLPIFGRPPTDGERQALADGLRAPAACGLCRCRIRLASARGDLTPAIARHLGCDPQTARTAIHAVNAHGLGARAPGSSRPRAAHAAFAAAAADPRVAVRHRRPRDFGRPTSLGTAELAAEVSFAEGLTAERGSGETGRATLARRGVGWRRAKRWITRPAPADARKKAPATA